MAKQVEDVYGNALFEIAQEENRIDEYLTEVEALVRVFEDSPELVAMMTHPQISEEEKESVLQNVFSGRVSDELFGLLRMVLEKGHFAEAEKIFAYFISRTKAYRKIGVVHVQTPLPLPDGQKEVLEKRLLDTTDFVSLEMHYDIEESLIGGMVIRIGDRVVDSSIRTKLERLSHELSSGR